MSVERLYSPGRHGLPCCLGLLVVDVLRQKVVRAVEALYWDCRGPLEQQLRMLCTRGRNRRVSPLDLRGLCSLSSGRLQRRPGAGTCVVGSVAVSDRVLISLVRCHERDGRRSTLYMCVRFWADEFAGARAGSTGGDVGAGLSLGNFWACRQSKKRYAVQAVEIAGVLPKKHRWVSYATGEGRTSPWMEATTGIRDDHVPG